MKTANVINHPLIQHKLSIMRQKETPAAQFRLLLKEIALLLVYEITRDLAVTTRPITTPLKDMMAPTLLNENISLISILRAGNGLLDGALELLPFASVGFIGLFRDPVTLKPVEYYCKLPAKISGNEVIVFDPMLATGYSAVAAIDKIKEFNPSSIKMVNLLAAPEGVAVLSKAHPDVQIYLAALDENLNDHGYIVPGLGDAGDRIYGTK